VSLRNKLIALLLLLNVNTFVYSQTYSYQYTDPCTQVAKTISVPINGSTKVSYYGNTENFTYYDFVSGAFQTWSDNLFNKFKNSSPCGEAIGTPTVMNIGQGQVLNTVGIINSISNIAETVGSATSSMSANIASSIMPSSSSMGEGPSVSTESGVSVEGGTSVTGTGGSSVSSGESGGTSSEGYTTSGGGSSSEEASGGSTNISAGGTNSVRGAGGSSGGGSKSNKPGSKEGGKPAIVASSDFVGFSFKDSEKPLGVKGTGGYTSMRWDGACSSGILFDYTSAQAGPNITGFYAWINPSNITIASGTVTFSLEGGGSAYSTVAFGQMKTFKKIKKLKLIYMGTLSMGKVFKEGFIGTAIITGGMYDLKLHKRLDVKLTNLIVYSPYVSYYNDVLMKSPFVMLPSVGVNVGVTKRFKVNINIGGAWQVGQSALNNTITFGTRLLL
jgi:hypothetical protein